LPQWQSYKWTVWICRAPQILKPSMNEKDIFLERSTPLKTTGSSNKRFRLWFVPHTI